MKPPRSYTETVEYVGSYANGTGETLGEKVFDLIDVRGIVVANDYGAIGLNWEDVLTGNTVYNKGAYIQYTAPAAGQTRFAYRDYTGAATEGGYYVPRVITVKIASDNADLGKAYRVLATGAKNPANTDEIRKVYGILGEIASDNSYVVTLKPIGSKAIDAMLAAAQSITPTVTDEAVQGNIYIDGKPASYKDAKALVAAQSASTAPGYYVDNDNDGTIDFAYLYTFAAAKVLSVDAENKKLTISGVGTKAYDSVEGIAAGDFIAFWGDKQFSYAKKLDAYTGKVTAYTRNSGAQQMTYADGKYTINGKDYTFGSLSTTFTDDERVYFQQLLGLGTSAVQDATLKFVFDGSYIVAVFVDEKETHWDNYAVVIGVRADGNVFGMPHVRLLTEDNEYKDFAVASYNGQQIYNNIASWSAGAGILVDYLYRYEEIGNGQIALYEADWVNSSYAYTNEVKMVFDSATGMWEGHEYYNAGIQNGTLYDWKNGVVFVSYGKALSDVQYPDSQNNARGTKSSNKNQTVTNTTYTVWNSGAWQWRAYLYGEFMPSDANEAGAPTLFYGTVKDMDDEVVYATALNGIRTLKAAAIIFDWESNGKLYNLPGLPLRAGDHIWGTVMSTTAINTVIDPADSTLKYAYKFNILKPWSTATQEITVYSPVRLQTMMTGDVYKLFMDSDNVCRRWEKAASAATIGNLDILGTDYLELGGYVITGIIPNSDGSYYFVAKKGIAAGTFSADTVKLYVGKDADLYFVKNLFKSTIEAVDYITSYGTLGTLSFANHKEYIAYFDINPSTNEVLSGWIDVAGSAKYTVKNVPITVNYNTNTKTATYTLDPAYGVFFAGGETEIEVVCEPYELKAPIGDQVKVDLAVTLFPNGGWYVADADAISGYKWEKYDASNASGVNYTGAELKIDTPFVTMYDAPRTFYLNVMNKNLNKDTQAFFAREGVWNGVYPAYGDTNPFSITAPANQYFPLAGAAGQAKMNVAQVDPWNYQYGYNPDLEDNSDVNSYTYEYFYVLYNNERDVVVASGVKEKVADAAMIVYVDANGTVNVGGGSAIAWPFN